jgi:hypothetical protein
MKPPKSLGWVKVRRGLIEHLAQGIITPNEFTVFLILLLMADSATGSGTVNAPVMQSCYLPDWSSRALQRALARLEDKHYIWRLGPVFSRRAYPYWVNKYEATVGGNRLSRSDLSQVFVSGDIKDLRWVRSVGVSDDVTVDVGDDVTVDVTVDSYKKLRTKERKNVEPRKTLSKCDSNSDSNSDHLKIEDASSGESHCVTGDVTQSVTSISDSNSDRPLTRSEQAAARLAKMFTPKPAPDAGELTPAQEEALALKGIAEMAKRRGVTA